MLIRSGCGAVPTARVLRMCIGVFTHITRRQNFDARPGTDWAISFLMLSIGRHVKKNSDAVLPV